MEEQSSPKEAEAQPKAEPEQKEELISFANFQKIDLRVAQIIEAERIEKSEKLIRLQVSLGDSLGQRQIVAGIAKKYSADELVGRKIAVVANLKPAKLMGQLSEGMLLAATNEELGDLELLSVAPTMPAGAKIS